MFFNSKPGAPLSRTLLYSASLGVIALLVAEPSMAQEVSPPPAQGNVETVVVTATGTLVKGVAPVGADVATYDAAQIQSTGALTTDQVLGNIPLIANAFNTNTVSPTAGNIGGVRPSIRYVPSTAITGGATTLVLLDGHNFVGVSGLATAPDPGLIPAIALKQVDVLPDGASSVYGANAVTGVINFITRNDFTGLETNVALGHADGYEALDVSAMTGTQWTGGGAFVALDYRKNTFLMARERSWSAMNLTSIGGRDSRATACALPNVTAAGASPNNYAQTGYPSTAPGSLAANVTGPFPGLNGVTNAGSLNRCDTNQNISMFPREDQSSFFGGVHQEIMPGVVLSAKLLYSSRFDTQRNNAPTATGTIDTTNPYFQSLHGETQQTVQFSFAPALGQSYYDNTSLVQVLQFTPDLSVNLPFGDWTADIMANVGRSNSYAITPLGVNTTLLNNSLRQTNLGGVLSPALTANQINGNAIDPYNIAASNPTLIQSVLDDGGLQKAIQHQNQAQATFNGTLFTLPWGGAVKGAIGAKYDWEDYVARWSVNSPTGSFPNSVVPFGEQSVWEGTHRTVSSGFAEITAPLVSPENNIPLVKSFSVDISGRIDGYSDFGEANTYKIGASWDPIDELTIRGTRGTSYDAPSLADTLGPDGRYAITYYSSTPNALVPPGTSPADALRPSILVPGGNPNLGPENGTTWSLGADFHPHKIADIDLSGFDFSLTRWHIFIEHQIGLLVGNSIIFSVPSYSQFYRINPTLAQVQSYGYTTCIGCLGNGIASAFAPGQQTPYILYDARRNNLGNAKQDGYDFAASYAHDLDFAVMTLGTQGTVSLQNVTSGGAGQPWTSIQATGVPLYQLYGYLQLDAGPAEGRISVQQSPGFNVPTNVQSFTLYNQTHIPSFHPVNLYLSYNLGDVFSWTNGMAISLTVNNIADSQPPLYLAGGSVVPNNGGTTIAANGSTLGRYFLLDLRKTF
jgi:iron complex outermembrane receptor protein